MLPKMYIVFMPSTRYSCHILLKLEFSQRIFNKCWNMKFYGCKKVENKSFGQNIMSICYEESLGQSYRVVVLKKKKKKPGGGGKR